MKRIIDIDEKDYKLAYDLANGVNAKTHRDRIYKAIVNGTPYNPTGDLISREALKKAFKIEELYWGKRIIDNINNAPTVEPEKPICNQIAWEQGYEVGYAQGKHERPQGKWIYQPNHTHLDNVKKYFCPFCRVQVNYPSDTCNNCGADMRGKEERMMLWTIY